MNTLVSVLISIFKTLNETLSCMTIVPTPYILEAIYRQAIAIFRTEERRSKFFRNVSRPICQTTWCHIPHCCRRCENHNSHDAHLVPKSTGRGPTTLFLDLQKGGISLAVFYQLERTHENRRCTNRIQNSCQHCVYKTSRLVVTGIGHPLYRDSGKYFPV
jgi:hypothetical protein